MMLSMIARDAQARSVAASLFAAYIEYVCDADGQGLPGNFGYVDSDFSFRDFVQAGVDDGGLWEQVLETTGIDTEHDRHFLELVLHFAQVGGVRI